MLSNSLKLIFLTDLFWTTYNPPWQNNMNGNKYESHKIWLMITSSFIQQIFAEYSLCIINWLFVIWKFPSLFLYPQGLWYPHYDIISLW